MNNYDVGIDIFIHIGSMSTPSLYELKGFLSKGMS